MFYRSVLSRNSKRTRTRGPSAASRRGNILVLAVLSMVGLFAFLALALDVGYVYTTRAQLQRSADAAAMAGAWELFDEANLRQSNNMSGAVDRVRSSAANYAGLNGVGGASIALAPADIQVGYLANPTDPKCPLQLTSPEAANAVQIRARRTSDQNGEVPLFFARVLGSSSVGIEAEATAALLTNVRGFRTPDDGTNLPICPIVIDLDGWSDLVEGSGSDDWTWDNQLQEVSEGSDGIVEMNLYPLETTSGNRGTVNIGSDSNGTAELGKQIKHGLTENDIDFHGGSLELDSSGQLSLGGNPGLSNSLKADLEAIVGETRIMPVFDRVTGEGNTTDYRIVRFVGARIMYVEMNGNPKTVIIQPANIAVKGALSGTDGVTGSQFIYSPVWLVR